MIKLFVVFSITLLSWHLAYSQGNWITYKIDDKLSCKLPSEPVKNAGDNIMAKTADSVVCIITVIDLQKTVSIDSATLSNLAPQSDFIGEIKKAMASRMPGFALGDFKAAKWNNYYSYSMEGRNPGKNFRIYSFMVLIGTRIYSLSALLSQHTNPAPKDVFFASLRLN